MRRSERVALLLSLAAFVCLVATQVIFWMFTYPMNVASSNWTSRRTISRLHDANGNTRTLPAPC